MRISASTLTCPDWSLATVLEKLKAYGYDAVDFRGLGKQVDLWALPEFTTNLADTAGQIARSGLAVSGLSSSALLFSPPPDRPKHLEELKQYAQIARALGAPMVRVFGGRTGRTPLAQAVDVVVQAYRQFAAAAGDDIMVAMETHDEWVDTRYMRKVFEQLGDLPNVGAIWDLHHPFRQGGESPKTTYDNIGRWVVGVHVKDSLPLSDGKYQHALGGQGDVPLAEMIHMLAKGGYDGYLTLEWEKRWLPTLAEPDVVLPQYAQFMRSLTTTRTA